MMTNLSFYETYYICQYFGNEIRVDTDDNYDTFHLKIYCDECERWNNIIE